MSGPVMTDGPLRSSQPVALVSGASRGIGLGLASALVSSGDRVALLARSAGDLVRAAEEFGDRALPVIADVTAPAEVTRAVAQVEARWGPVELLVHCAGSTGVIGPLWEADPDAWWDEVAVHLRGAGGQR